MHGGITGGPAAPLLLAPIGAIAIEVCLLAMQQIRHLVAVMDVHGGGARTITSAGLTVQRTNAIRRSGLATLETGHPSAL